MTTAATIRTSPTTTALAGDNENEMKRLRRYILGCVSVLAMACCLTLTS